MARLLQGAPLKNLLPYAAAIIAAFSFSLPAHASGGPAAERQVLELKGLQALDQRVADIGWRLATANLELCPRHFAATGLNLHTASQYARAYRQAAQTAFGFTPAGPSVLSVAQGSPAWRADMRPDDVILAVDGARFAAAPAAVARAGTYAETDAAMHLLETLPAGQSHTLLVARGDKTVEVALSPQAACASRFEMATGGELNANSNGSVVQVYGGLVVTLTRDDDLALVMAHELAHNILGHNQAIAAQKLPTGLSALFTASGRKVRDFERQADRYGIFMAARAGFDYTQAPQFWRHLAASGGPAAWIAATHPTPGNREKNAQEALAEIAELKARGLPLIPQPAQNAQPH